MEQKIYYYHYQTGEYFGEGFAEQSPLDPPGTWLIPMFATELVPPTFDPAAELCVFTNGTWLVSPIPMPQPDPTKEPEVPTVPASVTMLQARLALLQAKLLAQVNAAVAEMPGAAGDAARIEWEFSSTVERHYPLVESLGVALGMTDAQLDDLFTLAATL